MEWITCNEVVVFLVLQASDSEPGSRVTTPSRKEKPDDTDWEILGAEGGGGGGEEMSGVHLQNVHRPHSPIIRPHSAGGEPRGTSVLVHSHVYCCLKQDYNYIICHNDYFEGKRLIHTCTSNTCTLKITFEFFDVHL